LFNQVSKAGDIRESGITAQLIYHVVHQRHLGHRPQVASRSTLRLQRGPAMSEVSGRKAATMTDGIATQPGHDNRLNRLLAEIAAKGALASREWEHQREHERDRGHTEVMTVALTAPVMKPNELAMSSRLSVQATLPHSRSTRDESPPSEAINRPSAKILECWNDCHGNCGAKWANHNEPQRECHYCKKFDHQRAELAGQARLPGIDIEQTAQPPPTPAPIEPARIRPAPLAGDH